MYNDNNSSCSSLRYDLENMLFSLDTSTSAMLFNCGRFEGAIGYMHHKGIITSSTFLRYECLINVVFYKQRLISFRGVGYKI
jgi:hypothetical protein